MKEDVDSNTYILKNIENEIKIFHENGDKLVVVEGELNEFKDKAINKIKKNKSKFDISLKKNTSRTNEIDNNLKGLYSMLIKLNKQISILEEKKKKADIEMEGINDLERNESSNLILQNDNPSFQINFSNNQIEELKEELKGKIDKLDNSSKVHGDEIDKIKKILINQKRNADNLNNNLKEDPIIYDNKSDNIVKPEDLEEIKKIMKMFSDNETILKDSISEKIKKEELSNITKSFNLELDKIVLNQ